MPSANEALQFTLGENNKLLSLENMATFHHGRKTGARNQDYYFFISICKILKKNCSFLFFTYK